VAKKSKKQSTSKEAALVALHLPHPEVQVDIQHFERGENAAKN